MYFMDYVDEEKDNAKREGIKQGLEQGALDKSISTAKKMLQRGRMTLEEISEDTGLSLDKIEALSKELTEK